jgi:hypothetical protein
VGRHVAGAAGVGVVPPRAAHVLGLLEHAEVVDALLLEPDRRAEPAEARPDDRHVDVQVGGPVGAFVRVSRVVVRIVAGVVVGVVAGVVVGVRRPRRDAGAGHPYAAPRVDSAQPYGDRFAVTDA